MAKAGSASGRDAIERLPEGEVAGLAERFHGELIRPDDEDYDDARRVWNGMVNRFPAVVARCSGVADVATAVDFARENELVVAVRGGAHNAAGTATCDGSIVIDLGEMDGVFVDPERGTARVGGGARWIDVDRETQVFGLATPGGVSRTRASRGSRSTAATATSGASTAWPVTTCGRSRSSPPMGRS